MKKYKFIEDFKKDYKKLKIIDRCYFNIILVSIPMFFIGLFLNISEFEIIGASLGFSISIVFLISYNLINKEYYKNIDNSKPHE